MPQHRRRVRSELRLQFRHAFQRSTDIALLRRRAYEVNESCVQLLFERRHRDIWTRALSHR